MTTDRRLLNLYRELLVYVRFRPNGAPASKLNVFFISLGFKKNDIQREIRLALDRGKLTLGPKLELFYVGLCEPN